MSAAVAAGAAAVSANAANQAAVSAASSSTGAPDMGTAYFVVVTLLVVVNAAGFLAFAVVLVGDMWRRGD